MKSSETDPSSVAAIPTPREVYEESHGANPEAKLCVEAVARDVAPPQQNAEASHGNVIQDENAYDNLFKRSKRLNNRSISQMITGFERPHRREQ